MVRSALINWDSLRGETARGAELRRPTLIETCWHLRAPSGRRLITSAIYRDAASGLEVRVGYSEDDLLRSQRTADSERRERSLRSGRRRCSHWAVSQTTTDAEQR
jgi:hypothetical protein